MILQCRTNGFHTLVYQLLTPHFSAVFFNFLKLQPAEKNKNQEYLSISLTLKLKSFIVI